MKIIDVTVNRYEDISKQDMAHANGQEIVVVHIHTDAGVSGMGFFNLPVFSHGISGDIAVLVLRRNFRNVLLGEDPLLHERIWTKLSNASVRLGRRGIVRNCMAAVDFALWDIKGKLLNVPVANLFGDRRSRVLTYANVGHQLPPEQLGERALGYVRQGHSAVKIRVGSSAVSLDEATARVRAVREAIGPNVKLMVDVNGTWDADTAIQKLKGWEPYDLYWIEEPVPPEDVAGYLRVKQYAGRTYIVGGEQNAGLNEFKAFIDQQAIDIVQPNAIATGGITDWLKIYHYATASSIPIAPWNLHQIHIHLAAGLPNVKWIEYFTTERTSFLNKLIAGSKLREEKDGEGIYLIPPEAPGLESGSSAIQDLPGSYNGFIYVLEGSGTFGENKVDAKKGQAIWLGSADESKMSGVHVFANEKLRLVLFAGEPLREPVVAQGPFVMNTDEEIRQAYRDYHEGKFLNPEK